MLEEAIFHLPYGSFAYAISDRHARIMLRAKRGDLRTCHVVHEDRYRLPDTYQTLQLLYSGSDELFDYFQATVESRTKRIRYRFLLDDGVKRVWYGENGFADTPAAAGWFQLPYLCARDQFSVPAWVDEAVVYQIFPDRFENGNPLNDPDGVRPWGELPTSRTFFGGDLQGITDKLPYLQELGVNLIFMTPIFKSPSTHKYDTADYFAIDPVFGELSTLKTLVQEAHKRGIRVMLDAVFNHAGSGFTPFLDVLEKGDQSKYKDWFHVHGFPVTMNPPNYETFSNGRSYMPKLRTENPEVREYLLSAAEFWMKEAGIDGWRLDVANEVDHAFWRAFRETVRSLNPEALIIGEVWHDSSPWLQGDQFDGVMNYLFRQAVIEFFAQASIDAEAFDCRLTKVRMKYKDQANRAMFNLLGSHDTARFLTLCGKREERMRLAVIFQMAYVGIPEIYYGDEIGMIGEDDPDCRRPMIWEKQQQNENMLRLHQTLIAIRKQHTALQRGCYRTVLKDPLSNLYGFIREDDRETILVLLNNHFEGQRADMPAGTRGKDLITGREYSGSVELQPYGASILLLQK